MEAHIPREKERRAGRKRGAAERDRRKSQGE
jgi:hypothetical protein